MYWLLYVYLEVLIHVTYKTANEVNWIHYIRYMTNFFHILTCSHACGADTYVLYFNFIILGYSFQNILYETGRKVEWAVWTVRLFSRSSGFISSHLINVSLQHNFNGKLLYFKVYEGDFIIVADFIYSLTVPGMIVNLHFLMLSSIKSVVRNLFTDCEINNVNGIYPSVYWKCLGVWGREKKQLLMFVWWCDLSYVDSTILGREVMSGSFMRDLPIILQKVSIIHAIVNVRLYLGKWQTQIMMDYIETKAFLF